MGVLSLPVHVEWGLCELLAHGWLHSHNPLPELRFICEPDSLPIKSEIDQSYESTPMPTYPDVVGRLVPGDERRREKIMLRHRAAVEAALRLAGDGSVLLV